MQVFRVIHTVNLGVTRFHGWNDRSLCIYSEAQTPLTNCLMAMDYHVHKQPEAKGEIPRLEVAA
jgi:hypothetical protein